MDYQKDEVTELLARYRSNHHDSDAFDKIFLLMNAPGVLVAQCYLYRYGGRFNYHDCEDAVARAFKQVVIKINQFKANDNGSGWILKIVERESKLIIRESKVTFPIHKSTIADRKDYLEVAMNRIFADEILRQLSDLDRKIIVLTNYGYKAEEVAQAVRKSVATVKRRLKEIREKYGINPERQATKQLSGE